ncbi:hypothetical protein EN836_22075 [Mesorhizobium sp. M1C.F.Ca.ET.193.01.1.1]|uniref:hypothetical protein n=1 Tax=unclassified Mesorhizobium TaxID=325217 RepID=UPI000FD1CDE8|nr:MULTISPECIES: hypothetical protein [unclassified Mesorhizobium]TGS95854.1 hypothetical protein EN820_42795 [bacterium M00.F.Ca.ET.177.01.1.1]TGQ51922.1 hypothetical protein EN853_22065 [Mesorhizobium sp. M1C.F.Ca.ET.210.01.1.1]TGQ68167.1 hypothetical protein EN855_022075 [Mesorhizobium sp. M1C.F.Ca.ET.212.01.1.1]TGR03445.1 hypothetical protein EN847_22065 [Mesorhizobium sp. M1C.F.Ca.ET.204.01.1.1]TGR24062.1 hypothetical protein EN839_22065 [Mesorhizobium sp. M1C.F.Ca.ET.196.01.1.1]
MPGLEALLSLIGPAYLAYYGFRVPVMVVWAILCAALWIWNNRPSKRQNGGAGRSRSASLMFFVFVATCYVAAHTGIYLLVQHLAGLWA